MKTNKHIPDWALDYYLFNIPNSVIGTITDEEYQDYDKDTLQCMRSQLVAEHLEKRKWVIR